MTTKKKPYVTPEVVAVPMKVERLMGVPSDNNADAKDNNFSTDNGDHSSDGNSSWGNSSPWGE